jgi:hypothetical protein
MFKGYFKSPNPGEIAKTQLADASCYHLEHQAAAEYHQALADMYLAMSIRLTPPTPQSE